MKVYVVYDHMYMCITCILTYMYKFPLKRLMLMKIITIVMVFCAIIITIVSSFFVVYSRSKVNGYSMLPTLNSSFEKYKKSDIVYINRFANVCTGDIVVLDLSKHPNFSGYAVKRLIATEGDIVNIVYDGADREYELLVNNKVFYSMEYKDFGYNTYNSFLQYVSNHQYDTSRIYRVNDEIQGIIIKSNEVFVLGDNWDLSKDSSMFGPFKKSTIVGRVDVIVKPYQNEFLQILKQIF